MINEWCQSLSLVIAFCLFAFCVVLFILPIKQFNRLLSLVVLYLTILTILVFLYSEHLQKILERSYYMLAKVTIIGASLMVLLLALKFDEFIKLAIFAALVLFSFLQQDLSVGLSLSLPPFVAICLLLVFRFVLLPSITFVLYVDFILSSLMVALLFSLSLFMFQEEGTRTAILWMCDDDQHSLVATPKLSLCIAIVFVSRLVYVSIARVLCLRVWLQTFSAWCGSIADHDLVDNIMWESCVTCCECCCCCCCFCKDALNKRARGHHHPIPTHDTLQLNRV
jgi:hypothetical protein